MDLFGLGKAKAPEEPQDAGESEPVDSDAVPTPPRGSHRLWAFLLVLDSVFVVVFAGAVAAKFYQHWRAPSAPSAPSRRKAVKEPPKPAEPQPAAVPDASTAPTPAAPAEPVKEPPKETAKTDPAPNSGMRPPKPSLLTDAPKPRATPKLADSTPAATTAPGLYRPKAKPIVFRLRAPAAKSVFLVGAFIARGGRQEMTKGADGTWEAEVYLHPGQYRYFFSADKKKILDPENPRSAHGFTLLTVP